MRPWFTLAKKPFCRLLPSVLILLLAGCSFKMKLPGADESDPKTTLGTYLNPISSSEQAVRFAKFDATEVGVESAPSSETLSTWNQFSLPADYVQKLTKDLSVGLDFLTGGTSGTSSSSSPPEEVCGDFPFNAPYFTQEVGRGYCGWKGTASPVSYQYTKECHECITDQVYENRAEGHWSIRYRGTFKARQSVSLKWQRFEIQETEKTYFNGDSSKESWSRTYGGSVRAQLSPSIHRIFGSEAGQGLQWYSDATGEVMYRGYNPEGAEVSAQRRSLERDEIHFVRLRNADRAALLMDNVSGKDQNRSFSHSFLLYGWNLVNFDKTANFFFHADVDTGGEASSVTVNPKALVGDAQVIDNAILTKISDYFTSAAGIAMMLSFDRIYPTAFFAVREMMTDDLAEQVRNPPPPPGGGR